jgi:phage replication-related protein YjqB (UPF0714/DUF867 family)
MDGIGRRALLGAAVAGTAGIAWWADGTARPAHAADDLYGSNTALYADPELTEGQDYRLRFRRHAADGTTVQQVRSVPATAVLAPHGGGIELGTSELCLAVAGYHPDTLEPQGTVYDYWMFEGLRSSGNGDLHVTSTGCDDPAARSLAGGSRHTVTLHGCSAQQAGAPAGNPQAVLVGGAGEACKARLMYRLGAAGFQVLDGDTVPELAGVHPDNITNRTLLRGGGQLELTWELRDAMFDVNTAASRRKTTTDVFWTFTAAVRQALTDVRSATR